MGLLNPTTFGGSLANQTISGAATGALGFGFGQLSNALNMRRQYKYWKKQQDYMNVYNAPDAQVERLKQAGLNPGLMYSGNSGSSMQGSVSPMNSQSGPMNTVDPMSLQRMQNETKVSDATANRDNAQAELFRSQKIGQDNVNRTFDEEFRSRMDLIAEQIEREDLQNQWQEVTNDILSATKETEIHLKIEQLNNLIADTNLKYEQIEHIYADISLKAATVKLNEALARHANSQTWQIEQLTPKQVAFITAEIANMNADTLRKKYNLNFDISTRKWQRLILKYTAEDTYQLSELRENQRLAQRFLNRHASQYLVMQWMNAASNVVDAMPVSVNYNHKK